MYLLRLGLLALFLTLSVHCKVETREDNEFENFEAADESDVGKKSEKTFQKVVEQFPNVQDDDEMVVDEDDSEFEHLNDGDEFEGYPKKAVERPVSDGVSVPQIKITEVPIHFQTHWDNYWLEMLMIAGLIVYFINFVSGKNKNTKIANVWLNSHRQLLEDNFALVGDDGSQDVRESPCFVKESENIFTLWCSGRTCCEGMLVELKLIMRQDLVAIISGLMRPQLDQVTVKVLMNREDMDTFVCCVATKKTATRLAKDMADLSVYCPERRPGDKHNLPATFNVMGEIAEATAAMLDSKVTAVITRYPHLVDFIHISDQYSGQKQQDDGTGTPLKQPEAKRVLMFGFNMPVKGMTLEEAVEQLKPVMVLVFYMMEKIKRYKLSKEGKSKADKNRARVEEAFLKSTHQARAEAAAARREERRRVEKEKVMAEDDPDRQRRWEEKEQKRQAKKRAPRMKQLKVKAL